jgi:serine/threonine protein phosphatase PrpC
MKVTSFGGTDPGKRRTNNEDSYLVNDRLHLYCVADGIGGNEGGEVASRIAVETLEKTMPDLLGDADRTPPSGTDLHTDPNYSALRQAIMLANQQIRKARSEDPLRSNMGTTLTALLLKKKQAIVANVGDSRAYLLRSGKIKQLTQDHSFIAEYMAAGLLTSEEAKRSPYRHVITRAVGIDNAVQPDLTEYALQQDDRILLCTDGLTEMLSDSEISAILSGLPSQDMIQDLLAAANDHGGVDNITTVVVWIHEI